MHEDGYITAEEAEQAKAEPLELAPPGRNRLCHRRLFRRGGPASSFPPGLVSSSFMRAVYSVRTTVDPKLQEVADTQPARWSLITYDRRHWLARPRCGSWKALTTGRSNWPRWPYRPAVKSGSLQTVLEVSADRYAETRYRRWWARPHSSCTEVKWARKWLEGSDWGRK